VASIKMADVSVEIPIFDVDSTSLRKLIVGATGGGLAKSGHHIIVNALKGINFEACDGDRIGLIGRNGSGKTTLLRVLSDVYPPTKGRIEIWGRVSAMFDASLGMSPDATGIENIRICGMLWGLSNEQVKQCVPEIIEFTELGDHLNVPVRTYSQGMFLRLAFAIATVRDPEILLLDEVIGVGDAVFFEKAMARLMGLVHRSQILVVASHADNIIRDLCNKVMWLHNGAIREFGDVESCWAPISSRPRRNCNRDRPR
jgi:ABC-2 type transport system ATP-binding protein